MKADIGDWIRFYRNGDMFISEVVYISNPKDHVKTYHTHHGKVNSKDVLEVRSK